MTITEKKKTNDFVEPYKGEMSIVNSEINQLTF